MVYKSRRLLRRPVYKKTRRAPSRPMRKRSPTMRRAAPKRRSAPRKRASKRRKTAAPKKGGVIITGKPVTVPSLGSCIRQVTYGEVSTVGRAWLGASNTGSEKYFMTVIAEAMICKILRECKDFRSDKQSNNQVNILDTIAITFQRAVVKQTAATITPGDLDRIVTMGININSNSVDGMVQNYGASPNLVLMDSATYPGSSPTFQPGWNRILYDQAIQGYFPVRVVVTKGNTGAEQTLIYHDTQLGDMTVAMTVDGSHRFQNVTPANQPKPASGDAPVDVYTDGNRNSIRANPLSGKLFTFGHLAPKYNEGWLDRQTGDNMVLLNNFSGRPQGWLDRTQTDKTLVWDYAAISAYGPGSLPLIPEFVRPPLRPSTLFSNVKTSSPVSMSPGAINTYKTKFSYTGTFTRLLSTLTQVTKGDFEKPAPGKFPSLGDSFMMCLVPTMQTQDDEKVSLGFQYTKVGKAHFTSKKGGYLPTTSLEYEA